MNTDKAIMVWRWEDAPEDLRQLSWHGGDESWVALVPAALRQEMHFLPPWMDEGSSFGCCSVSEHELPNGDLVVIGAHA